MGGFVGLGLGRGGGVFRVVCLGDLAGGGGGGDSNDDGKDVNDEDDCGSDDW